jgi:ferric-dicitrate binding protein FerR (iron transport regulator)
MNREEYQNFEDFILDESFREYVLESREDSILYWKNWIENHSDKADEVKKAVNILNTLLHTRKIDLAIDKYESLQEILDKIEDESTYTARHRFSLPGWAKVAALSVLSIGLAWCWNQVYTMLKSPEVVVYTEIIVPIGEKSQVVLSDGTHVWINSGSSFKYPQRFAENEREVFLKGEAFFDVTKRNKQLFVVNTQDARVKVFGTAFNVKAYPEDTKTQTTVTRGLVSVQSTRNNEQAVLIRPNQMAVIKKETTALPTQQSSPAETFTVIDKINVEAVTCWKDQLLVFNNETFEDMALKMERWFNVKINIKDNSLKKERFNGKFVHNETVYQVLDAIKLTTPIRYKGIDNEIEISLNK